MMRAAVILLLLANDALAHEAAHAAEQGVPGWTLDPWIIAPLLIIALLHAIGSYRLRERAAGGRPRLDRRVMLFAAGWLVLAASLVSPLHKGGERSFTLHMIEHELIMAVAAALLVIARPGVAMLWALPHSARRRLGEVVRRACTRAWGLLTDPIVATSMQGVVLWIWHMPALFDRALEHEAWHVAQHVSFLASSLIFWWAMAYGRSARSGYGVSCLCLFATSMIESVLGALMSFSASPWYALYAQMGPTPYGLTPLQDQQLAGLLMWIPGGLVHAAAALLFLRAWLEASEASHAPATR